MIPGSPKSYQLPCLIANVFATYNDRWSNGPYLCTSNRGGLQRLSFSFLKLLLLHQLYSPAVSKMTRFRYQDNQLDFGAYLPLNDTSGNANPRINSWRGESSTTLTSGFDGPVLLNPYSSTHPSHFCYQEEKDQQGKKRLMLRRIPGALSRYEQSRYRQYRMRARRNTKPDGEQIWSDDAEEAFQIGARHRFLPVQK